MIAFCMTGGTSGSNQIFLINQDGSGLKQLTNDSNGYTWVRFSRDGNYLLTANLLGHVWIYTVAGTLVRQLTNLGATGRIGYHQGDWSPDGTQVVLCNNDGGGATSTLQIVNVDNSNWWPVNLGPGDVSHQMSIYTPSAISWSPDGTKFVFPIGPTGGSPAVNIRICDIGTITGGIVDGTTGTTLTAVADPEGVLPCRWINNTTILAVVADRSSGQNTLNLYQILGGTSILYIDPSGTVLNMADTFVATDLELNYVWVNVAKDGLVFRSSGASTIFEDSGNSISNYGLDFIPGAPPPVIVGGVSAGPATTGIVKLG